MKTKIFTLIIATVATLCSCSKEDNESLTLNKTSISLYSTERDVITTSTKGCSFRSECPGIADVSSNGEVVGICVGTTRIKVSNRSQMAYCNVTVNPRYSMYREPYMGFGKTKSDVKAFETRTLTNENSTGLVYKGENNYIEYVAYVFEDGLLTTSGCVVSNTYASMLGSFIAERYILGYVDSSNNTITSISPDLKVAVGIKVMNVSYSMVVYIPVSASKSSSIINESKIERMFNSMMDI